MLQVQFYSYVKQKKSWAKVLAFIFCIYTKKKHGWCSLTHFKTDVVCMTWHGITLSIPEWQEDGVHDAYNLRSWFAVTINPDFVGPNKRRKAASPFIGNSTNLQCRFNIVIIFKMMGDRVERKNPKRNLFSFFFLFLRKRWLEEESRKR